MTLPGEPRQDNGAPVVGRAVDPPRDPLPRSVLVTGGAGFVGAALVRALAAAGVAVRVLDDLSSGRPERLRGLTGVELHQGSVLDGAVVERAVAGCEAVCHLAAVVGVQRVLADPARALTVNFDGTRRVALEAARAGARLLYASSSEVLGPGTGRAPMGEDDPPLVGAGDSPRWSYAVAKLAGERLVEELARDGASGLVVRFFNTTGADQGAGSGMVLPRMVARAAQGLAVQVHGDGSQVRSFCHVDDAVRALVALLRLPRATYDGRVLHVGSQQAVSVLELARLVAARTGAALEHVPYAAAYGPGFEDVRHRVPDTSRLARLVGWSASRGLEEIVDEVLAAARAQRPAPAAALP